MSNDDSEKTRNSVGETNPYVDSVVRGSEMGIGASRKDSKNGDLKTVEKACRDFRVALEGKEGGVIKKIEKELKKIEADVKSVMSMNIPDAEVLRLAHGQLVDRLKEIQAEYNRLFQSSNEIEFVLQRTVSPETRGDILTRIGDSEAIVTVKHKNGKTYRVEQSTEDPDSVVLFPRDTNSSAFSMKKASLLDRGRIPSFFIDEKKVSQVGKLGGVALFDHDDVEQAPEIDEREYHHVDTSATPVKNIRTGGESGTEKVKKETKSGRRVVDIVPKTKITTRPPQTPPRPPQAGGHKVTREARAPYEIGRTDHDLALNNGILEALRVLGKDAKGLKYVIKSSRGGEVKNVTITRVSEDAVFVRFEHEQGKQRGKVIKIGEQKWNDSMPVLVTDSDSHEQKKNVNVSDAVASTRYDTDGKSTQLESPAVATEVARENGEKFSDAVWGDVKRDKKDLNRIWQTFVSKFASAEDVPEGFAKMYTDLETGLTELLATVEGRQAEEQKKTDRGEPGGYVEGKKFNLLKIEGNQYDTLTKRYNQFARELEDFETSIEKKSDEPLENSESDGTAEFPYIANSSEHVQALQRGDFDAFFTEQDPTGSEQIGKRYDILVSPTDPKERVEVKIVGFLQKEGGVGVVYVGLDGEGNEKGPQKTLSPEEWEARSPVLGTMDDVDFADVRYAPSPGHEASSSVQVEPTLREPVRKPTVRDLVVEDLVAEHLRHPATMEKQPPEDEKAPGTQKEVEREVRHMTATELYQTMIEHREGAEGSHGMVEATDGQGNRFTLREDETMVEPAIIGWPIGRGSKIYESLADFLKRPDVTLYIDGVPLAVTLDEGAQPVESAESERVPGVKENGEPLFLLECVEFSDLCKGQLFKENTANKSSQEIEILYQFSDLGGKIKKFVDTIDYSVYAANPKLTQPEIEVFKLFKKEFDDIQEKLEEFRAKEKESAGVPSAGELMTADELTKASDALRNGAPTWPGDGPLPADGLVRTGEPVAPAAAPISVEPSEGGSVGYRDEPLTPEELDALTKDLSVSGRQPLGAPVETGNDAVESLKQRLDDLKVGYRQLLEDIEKSGARVPAEKKDYVVGEINIQLTSIEFRISHGYGEGVSEEHIKADERRFGQLRVLWDEHVSNHADPPPASDSVPAGFETHQSEVIDAVSNLSPLAPEIAESRAKLQQHAVRDLDAVKGVIEELMRESGEINKEKLSKLSELCDEHSLVLRAWYNDGKLLDSFEELKKDIDRVRSAEGGNIEQEYTAIQERYNKLFARFDEVTNPFADADVDKGGLPSPDAPAVDTEGWAEFDPEHEKSEEELSDVVSTLLNESHSLYSEINRLSPGEYDDIYHQTRKRLVHEFEDLGSDKSARSTFLRTKFIPELISFRDTGIILKAIWDKKRSSVLALLRNPANWETTHWNKKFWKKKHIRGYIKKPTELLLSNASLGFENVTEVNDYIRFLEDTDVVYGEWNKKKQRFVSIRLRDYGDSDEPEAVVEASSAENSLDQQGDTANDTDLLKKLTDVETDEHGIDTISAVFAEHDMERLVLLMIQDGDQGFATALADMKTWFSGDSLFPATERWMASLEAKQGINREAFSQRWEQSIAERVLGSLRYMIMTKIEQGVLMDREYQDALDGKYALPKDSFKALALRSGYSAIPAVITGVLATFLSGGVVAVVGASAAFVGSFSYGALQLRDTKKNADVQTYQANLGTARERATGRATGDVQTQLGDRDNIPLLSQMFRSALIAESTTDMDSQKGMSALKELSLASKIKRSWMDMVRGMSPESPEANMATADYVLSALALRNAQQCEQSGFALAGATRAKGYMKKLVDVFSAGKVADVTGQTSTRQEYARITANAVIAGMQGAIIASHGTAEWWAKATLRFVTSGVVEGVRTGLEQKKMRTNMAEREFRAEVTTELKEYENALAQIGKGEFALREKKEEILMSVLPALRYAGDEFETLTQESPDIAARLTAVKTKVLHLQTELHNEYEQFGGRDSAVDFDERVRSTQQKNVYWHGTTVVGRLERRNLNEDDYLGVVRSGLFAGGVSAIGGGVLDSLRSSEVYQQALSALGIGHVPHGSSAVSSQHEALSPTSVREHTAGVERPSSPQEVVPRASAGAMPEHAEVREPADATQPPANRPARVAEALSSANTAPTQPPRALIVERAIPVQESAPKVQAHAPEIKVPETEKTVSTHIVPKKGGTFLGGARTLEKSLSQDDIARLRAEHPEWGTKKVDILKQWRIEQAEKNGQWFDSKAEHFKTRIHPGAEMRLEKGSDGYPRIVLGDDHVEHLDHELVKTRGAQTTPPEQSAKVFPVREGGADGKISPAERSVLDARAVVDAQRNADTTLTVGEKSGSVSIPDVPSSKASPSVDVIPGVGGTKASTDTTFTESEKSGVTAEKVAASASAAPDTQNAERVSHIVDRLTTDKYILADARTRAVTMKQGSVPLETFANDYVQARPEFDPKDPKDMFDFYQAWRQKSVEYITGGRGNGGGSIPDASRTSQKSLEPVVPKSETLPPTPSPASGERELPDVRVNKDIPIVLHQGLGDDMRQHVSVWDAGENKAVDIGIKQELRPQVRGGHLVLEISGQRTEGELIQHMVDGKKQWALKVSLPQLGRNEYYNLDNLNKGTVEPTVENR